MIRTTHVGHNKPAPSSSAAHKVRLWMVKREYIPSSSVRNGYKSTPSSLLAEENTEKCASSKEQTYIAAQAANKNH